MAQNRHEYPHKYYYGRTLYIVPPVKLYIYNNEPRSPYF